MKLNQLAVSSAIFAALVFSSCVKDQCTRKVTYTRHDPVYRTYAEIRQPIIPQPAREIRQTGKIFIKDNYLLVNEPHVGVHLIDIQNPNSPQNVAFIPIEGNMDIAMRNNTLFADNYTDLVAVDLTTLSNPRIIARTENVFPIIGSDNNGMIVDYISKEVTEEIACDAAYGYQNMWTNDMIMTMNGTPIRGTTGVGGSMSRFALYDKFLYCVDQQSLHVVNVAAAEQGNMYEESQMAVGWNIETIFPSDRNLFIGSQTGMFIYSIDNPRSPVQLSSFEHAQACDPVFASGNTAYVTLRSGTQCNNGANELLVVDVSNLRQPTLTASYPMHNPHGLSVRNNDLFLCEGDAGLKVFDVANQQNIAQNLRSSFANIHAIDVLTIPNTNNVVVVGKDGLHIYDASNVSGIRELSFIPALGHP
jgi:LVIVD repeat